LGCPCFRRHPYARAHSEGYSGVLVAKSGGKW
jgi:hypothetical protein